MATQISEMELHYEKCVNTGIFRHDESGLTFDSGEELVAHLRREEGIVPGEQSVHCPSCLVRFPAPHVGPHYEKCVAGLDSDSSLPCLRCSNRSENWKIFIFCQKIEIISISIGTFLQPIVGFVVLF